MGDRAGEGRAYANLGTCHMHLNEYVKAVAYFEAQHALAISLKLAHVQSNAAINTGRGRAGRTRTMATRIDRRGTFQRPSNTTGSNWRLQRRWATGMEDRAYANALATST